jgi:hypothetical protein
LIDCYFDGFSAAESKQGDRLGDELNLAQIRLIVSALPRFSRMGAAFGSLCESKSNNSA